MHIHDNSSASRSKAILTYIIHIIIALLYGTLLLSFVCIVKKKYIYIIVFGGSSRLDGMAS